MPMFYYFAWTRDGAVFTVFPGFVFSNRCSI